MTELILRQLVREVLRESESADPGEVAEQVRARIPKAQLASALSQSLRLYVRQVNSEIRVGNHGPAPTPIQANRSAKVAAIRDGWQRRLRDRVHVGDGTWKFLADCGYDDLVAAASERRVLADRNQAWAHTYESWARLLTEHDVATFAELPMETQASALGRAA